MSEKKHRASSFSIILGFVCLTLAGWAFIPLLPVKLAPSNSLPQISVSYSMDGMSSRVVEQEVTSRLESMLARVSGVEKVSSTSDNGYGRVTLQLNKYANREAARFETSTVIRQVYPSLPDGVSYPSVFMSRSDDNASGPFLSYTINAPSSSGQIKDYADKHIKPVLQKMEGVDEVNISGASPMTWQLEYDQSQLKQLGLSVRDLQVSVLNFLNKENLGSGTYKAADGRVLRLGLVLMPGVSPGLFDASKIPVNKIDGKVVYLSELVKTSHLEEEPTSYYRINGLNSLYLSVTAKEDANQLKLSAAIRKNLAELSRQFPVNYELHPVYDATEYIRAELNNVYFRTGLTVLVLLSFVLLVYRSGKYLLMVTSSLVCTLSVSSILYYILGLELQLYSLMGITISLTLILDNMIIMSDHTIRRKDKKAFLAIFAATCTTMAALVIIFFLEERIRQNLQDFARVILINLGVSLTVCLFLIPALVEKLQIASIPRNELRKKIWLPKWRDKRKIVLFNRFYVGLIRWNTRHRWVPIGLLVLGFGLPVFLLPREIQPKGNEPLNQAERLYNRTFGTTFYQEKVRPITDVALGGALRLFVQRVYEGSYWSEKKETSITVYLSMPNGSTLEQTNFLVEKMENYLRQFREIQIFTANVNKLDAVLNINFTKEHQKSGFPPQLQSQLINKALELGGGSWSVYGIGDGFSNNLQEQAGAYRIKMYGFNYDALYSLAEQVRDSLLQNRRIREVTIDSEFQWYKSNYQEFSFNLRKECLAGQDILPIDLFYDLHETFGKDIYAGVWQGPGGSPESIRLHSRQSKEYDIWMMNHQPGTLRDKTYRLSDIALIERTQAPMRIERENQQFRLCLQYEFIGADSQAQMVLEKVVASFKEILPLGYSLEKVSGYSGFGGEGKKMYWLLPIILTLIFFTTSILFNSLRQPFVVLSVIPMAFIGIFMTFYAFNLKFGQGGFAAFVLLSGITVNAGIYFINEFNNIRKSRNLPLLRTYIRAWNAKIVPVALTILSTMLGFSPFLVGDKKDFWFPLASGVIGGLGMSLLGIFIFVPLFLGLVKRK